MDDSFRYSAHQGRLIKPEARQRIYWTNVSVGHSGQDRASLISQRGVTRYPSEGYAMKKATAPIPFAGSQLDQTRHLCAFFNSPDEEYRVLLPFIKDGFQCGHKAIHVVNPDQHQDHLERLSGAGIDAAAAQQTGQLELRTNTETYLPEGRFDPDRMIAAFEQLASGNATGGFPLSRICCRMDWSVADRSHVDDVIEFES